MQQVLIATLDPDQATRAGAEAFLSENSSTGGYGLVLLHLLTMDAVPIHVRQAGAVTFKNYLKKGWEVTEESTVAISEADRAQIKTHIVTLMLSVPEQVQRQLSEGLGIIAQHDFPAKWQNLLPELIQQLGSGNLETINGVLQTISEICKRFRTAIKNDDVMEDYKYVLDTFQEVHLQIFTTLLEEMAKNNTAEGAAAMPKIMSSLRICSRIFLSLNSLDIPEFYEDHMNDWFGGFNQFLSPEFVCPAIEADDEDRPSVVEQVQAAVCDNLSLYMKYEEEFGKYLETFVPAVWQLLVSKGTQPKYDILVTTCIKFLTSVSESSVNHAIFQSPETLDQICTLIVIPNMKFREEDEELFEDNPQEYIRRDIEGSDTDTRRRTACELVKGLRKNYEGPTTEIFSKYVGLLLGTYSADPVSNWQDKDAAIYIVTSLAVKASTLAQGITQTNDMVDIVDFFQSHILPELQNTETSHQIIIADAISAGTQGAYAYH